MTTWQEELGIVASHDLLLAHVVERFENRATTQGGTTREHITDSWIALLLLDDSVDETTNNMRNLNDDGLHSLLLLA